MKKILILSAEKTGHGHKSIAEALCEQKEILDLPVEIHEIDSFTLGGKFMEMFGNIYNGVAVYTPFIWKVFYRAPNLDPKFANYIISFMIKRNLIKTINKYKPDIIVSLHACFVGSVINVLKNAKIDIPVIPYIADFDNATCLWADKRSLYTLCPTENTKRTMLNLGIPEDKIRLFGFPTRQRFNNYNVENDDMDFVACADNTEQIKFLIMNGSQGTNKSLKMARVLLRNINCTVTIIAGNSKALKTFLEDKLKPEFGSRVNILGFVENVEYYMHTSNILILRASPNVVTEAVNSCRPIIVTGSLMGQEEKNPKFVEENNLGIVCRDINRLPEAVNALLADNGRKLKEIHSSQIKFRKPEAARDILEFIYNCIDKAQ